MMAFWGDNETSADREIENRRYYNYYYNYYKDKDSEIINYLNTHYDSNARPHNPKEQVSVVVLILMAIAACVVVSAILVAVNWFVLWLLYG